MEKLAPEDLWFSQSGLNLLIGIAGTEDQVTITNWFAGDYMIDNIQAGSWALTESQVSSMVQAMAKIGAPAGANGLWTDDQRDDLAPLLAAYWKKVAA